MQSNHDHSIATGKQKGCGHHFVLDAEGGRGVSDQSGNAPQFEGFEVGRGACVARFRDTSSFHARVSRQCINQSRQAGKGGGLAARSTLACPRLVTVHASNQRTAYYVVCLLLGAGGAEHITVCCVVNQDAKTTTGITLRHGPNRFPQKLT